MGKVDEAVGRAEQQVKSAIDEHVRLVLKQSEQKSQRLTALGCFGAMLIMALTVIAIGVWGTLRALDRGAHEELKGHQVCAPQRLVKTIDGFAVCETPDPWPERKVVPLGK